MFSILQDILISLFNDCWSRANASRIISFSYWKLINWSAFTMLLAWWLKNSLTHCLHYSSGLSSPLSPHQRLVHLYPWVRENPGLSFPLCMQHMLVLHHADVGGLNQPLGCLQKWTALMKTLMVGSKSDSFLVLHMLLDCGWTPPAQSCMLLQTIYYQFFPFLIEMRKNTGSLRLNKS